MVSWNTTFQPLCPSAYPQVYLVYVGIEMIQAGKSFLKFDCWFLFSDKQETLEEGRRLQRPKSHVSTYHNKDEDKSPKNHNQNNSHQGSSKKFKQFIFYVKKKRQTFQRIFWLKSCLHSSSFHCKQISQFYWFNYKFTDTLFVLWTFSYFRITILRSEHAQLHALLCNFSTQSQHDCLVEKNW